MARVKRPRPTHHDEDGIRTHPRSEIQTTSRIFPDR